MPATSQADPISLTIPRQQNHAMPHVDADTGQPLDLDCEDIRSGQSLSSESFASELIDVPNNIMSMVKREVPDKDLDDSQLSMFNANDQQSLSLRHDHSDCNTMDMSGGSVHLAGNCTPPSATVDSPENYKKHLHDSLGMSHVTNHDLDQSVDSLGQIHPLSANRLGSMSSGPLEHGSDSYHGLGDEVS